MYISRCSCGNRLFLDSTQCVVCSRETGFCPECRVVRDACCDGDEDDPRKCSYCSTLLVKCRNYAVEHVCNQFVREEDAGGDALCEFCQLTRVIPDLADPQNRERWHRLEKAKRRVLIGIQRAGVPLNLLMEQLPLVFEFKANGDEPVLTGHASGVITINIVEADDVEREKTRVAFGEPQRTLVGHFRHELGHYFWEVLVRGDALEEFRQLFGDERADYAAARDTYYRNGPTADWQASFISAYATMHPWEDFAETLNAYLDMRSVLETANDFSVLSKPPADFPTMLLAYKSIGVIANEWNRDMGLLDLVPEVFVPPVAEKLKYVHRLLTEVAFEETGSDATIVAEIAPASAG